MPKAVLVVVDAQNGFVRETSASVVPVLRDLADRWLNAGGEVVFTRYINHPDSPFVRLHNWHRLMDSPDIDIAPELLPVAERATAVMDKTIYSFFSDEGVALVKEHGWTDFYVGGIATESCVLKTVVDAFERDLTPWLIQDASASHGGAERHQAGLICARHFIGAGQLITSADIPWETIGARR